MDWDNLHTQDKVIVVEALSYWAKDTDRGEEFDPSDPRRNRAAELVEELLRSEELQDIDFTEDIDPEWSGP